jgi:Leucine-rich repeat (LRR) protein
MNYIDLNIFFDSLKRNNIVELGIEQILFEKMNYISVYAIHYHNERDKDYFLIKSEQKFNIHNFSNISISPLYGLIQLERLKIINIDNLNELPSFSDSICLKTLICSNNNLIKLPRKLPHSLIYFNCSYNRLTELPVLHENMYIYCNHNKLYSLPLFPNTYVIYFDMTPIKNLYTSNNYNHMRTTNRILYKFKYNYYFIKYSRKIFYYFLRKKINRIKHELLMKSAIITMNPRRIERILNLYEICGYDFDDI